MGRPASARARWRRSTRSPVPAAATRPSSSFSMKPCGRIEHAVKSSGSRSPHSSPTESSHCGRSTPLKCPQGSSRIWCLHAAPALTERSAAADVPRATSTKRVLVIDDNVDVAEMLGLYLQQIGHEVIQAHDGPSGRDAALQHQPKVIVCDIGLPGLDGYESPAHCAGRLSCNPRCWLRCLDTGSRPIATRRGSPAFRTTSRSPPSRSN